MEKVSYLILMRNENPERKTFNSIKGYIITGTSDDAHMKANEITNPENTPEYDTDEPCCWLGSTSVIRMRDEFIGSDGPVGGEELYHLLATEAADRGEVVLGILNTLG
jgi:hypothetical protein